jgi:16S rRNA (uracil1498-N3)-methyltransferase
MHHFFLTPESIQAQTVTFPRQIAHQIRNVLRLRESDMVAVLDNSGMKYTVTLQFGPDVQTLTGRIVDKEAMPSEPNTHVALYFGLTSREKVEMILQKGTEVGVGSFHPFISSRTLVNAPTLPKSKHERWERIIQEAAEQSGRGRLPKLNTPESLTNCYLKAVTKHDLCLIAWENAPSDGFKLSALRKNYSGGSIALFVGPEGGFSNDEVTEGIEAGCQMVSLGTRILRMETAAIIFPALVLYELGEI